MSWWSSTPSIDEQVEKATSESLPAGESDLALNLEICDLIRSKTVPAKDAMRSLKRRVLNRNPNVQVATLHLTDICIKNGGSHFLVEVASREFIDPLVAIARNDDANSDVKLLLLELLQQWSIAFAGQLQLQQVESAVQQLKSEGVVFPSTHSSQTATSSFIDTKAPPEWIDSDVCMESGVAFSFLNRKHHCRNCGGVFTQTCCQNYITLPHFGINVPVRVCNGCFKNLKKGKATVPARESHPSAPRAAAAPSAAPTDDNPEEDDIQKAIRLSLQEQESYKPPPAPAASAPSAGEDDDDMKAAIAASLRDMESERQSSQSNNNNYGSSSAYPAVNSTLSAPISDDLTNPEESNINLLSLLVERLKSEPQGTILREPKIQELYETVGNLRPKLARTMGETISKYDNLVDMHAKMTTVIRYYDALLEEKLNQAYKGSSGQGYGGYTAPSAPPMGYGVAPQLTGQVTGQYTGGAPQQYSGGAPQQYSGGAPQYGVAPQHTGMAPQHTGMAPQHTGAPQYGVAPQYTGMPQHGGIAPQYTGAPSYPPSAPYGQQYNSAPYPGYDYGSSPSAPSAPGGPSAPSAPSAPSGPSAPSQPREEPAPLIEL